MFMSKHDLILNLNVGFFCLLSLTRHYLHSLFNVRSLFSTNQSFKYLHPRKDTRFNVSHILVRKSNFYTVTVLPVIANLLQTWFPMFSWRTSPLNGVDSFLSVIPVNEQQRQKTTKAKLFLGKTLFETRIQCISQKY